jgi:hypothetical protein
MENKVIKFLFFLSFLFLLSVLACSDSNAPSASYNQEYQRQLELYDQQARKADEQQIEWNICLNGGKGKQIDMMLF